MTASMALTTSMLIIVEIIVESEAVGRQSVSGFMISDTGAVVLKSATVSVLTCAVAGTVMIMTTMEIS